MRIKQKLEKHLLATLLLTVVLTSSIVGPAIWVLANPDVSFSTIIEAGSLVRSASYFIFHDGSYYYVSNGLTGEITEYSLFVYAFNNCSEDLTNGGKIHLAAGDYVATATLFLNYSYSIVEGEGRNATVIYATHSDDALYYENLDYIELRHFKIDCNDQALTGVHAKSVSSTVYRGYFLNIWVTQAAADGILVQGQSGGEGFDFQNCISDNNGENGLKLNGTYRANDCKVYGGKYNQNGGAGIDVNGSWFLAQGVHLGNNERGIYYRSFAGEIVSCYFHKAQKEAILLAAGVTRLGILGCDFIGSSYGNNGTYDVIHGDDIERVTIEACHFYQQDNYYARLIVNFTDDAGASRYNCFVGNEVYNAMTNTTQVADLGGAKNDAFSGNIINSGLTEYRSQIGGKTSGDWIAHKVFAEPTGVLVGVYGGTPAMTVVVSDKNSTHFQIYLYRTSDGVQYNTSRTITWFAFWRPP